MSTHTYATHLVWEGSTGAGYRAYGPEHTAIAPPATTEVQLSADAAFRGDPELLNPEQLLAHEACYIANSLTARVRLDVTVVDA